MSKPLKVGVEDIDTHEDRNDGHFAHSNHGMPYADAPHLGRHNALGNSANVPHTEDGRVPRDVAPHSDEEVEDVTERSEGTPQPAGISLFLPRYWLVCF